MSITMLIFSSLSGKKYVDIIGNEETLQLYSNASLVSRLLEQLRFSFCLVSRAMKTNDDRTTVVNRARSSLVNKRARAVRYMVISKRHLKR